MVAPARWYVLVAGEQTGPFELADVRAEVLAGRVGPETWVWADGMPEWRQALRVPALVPPPSRGVPGWPAPRPAAPGGSGGDGDSNDGAGATGGPATPPQ